jgi:hypothetical protein
MGMSGQTGSEAAARRLGVLAEIRNKGKAEVRIEATEGQVEKAIDGPEDVSKVQRQLGEAREGATREGTPQPTVEPKLETPRE